MRQGIHVTVTPMSVSVMEVFSPLSSAVASADLYNQQGVWWISRVKVPDKLQGVGVGSRLLKRLIEEVQKQGAKAIVVAPGGYNSDPDRQVQFYVRNGFKPSEADEGLYRMELVNAEDTCR